MVYMKYISQCQLCPSPSPGLTPGISIFFVSDGKFPGVGMKEEGKCPTSGILLHLFECEIHIHVDLSESHFSVWIVIGQVVG